MNFGTNMSIKEILEDYSIRELESNIVMAYNGPFKKNHDYTDERCLLQVRRDIINHYVLQHQEELLPHIIAFNDAVREALHKLYDKAHLVYDANKEFGDEVEVAARCNLGPDYPALHPVQGEDRQELWDALCDVGWNVLYNMGVTFEFRLPHDKDKTFDDFIGMNCPPPNWNEGLDQELTKDLHLIHAFHHLFDHTDFALTDFIYVREFHNKINMTVE